MEYLDFCSTMDIIVKNIREVDALSQLDLMYNLFHSFLFADGSHDFDFDNGDISRWINGKKKVTPRIVKYYTEKQHQQQLARDIQRNLFPIMSDSAMATQRVYDLLVQDPTISDSLKAKLTQNYPYESDTDRTMFLAAVLSFGMARDFKIRDPKTKKMLCPGKLSPLLKDISYDCDPPRPCRHFCGRDNELLVLHRLLQKHGKVFLQGIPGLGKSELANNTPDTTKKSIQIFFTYPIQVT